MTTGRDHSLGSRWTPVEAVVAAARDRRIFVMAWNPGTLDEHREVLVALSPDHVVAIRRSREQDVGWIGVRVGLDGADSPGTLCRLAPAGASGRQVLAALPAVEAAPPA